MENHNWEARAGFWRQGEYLAIPDGPMFRILCGFVELPEQPTTLAEATTLVRGHRLQVRRYLIEQRALALRRVGSCGTLLQCQRPKKN